MPESKFKLMTTLKQPQGAGRTFSPAQIVQENTQIINHVLIVDDSNRICSLLVTGIISSCLEAGYNCRIVQSGDLGLVEALPFDYGVSGSTQLDNQPGRPIFQIYIANSPRYAVPILKLPNLGRLSIISDIMMPADTTVGLIGMLDELARLRLPVNLVFTSSEIQNRDYVVALLKSGKAFFLEKGSEVWSNLPNALVNQTNRFAFKTIELSDYDNGTLRRYTPLQTEAETTSFFGRILNWFKNLGGN